MKFGKLTVPTAAEIVVGLDATHDPEVRAGQDRVHEERGADTRAQQRLRVAREAVTNLRDAVANGRARPAELEAALVAEQAAAMVTPQYAQRVKDAEAALERTIVEAKARVVAEAGARRDKLLQRVADELAPTLNALIAAEEALDGAVHAVQPGSGVVPVEWPDCRVTQFALLNMRILTMNVVRA